MILTITSAENCQLLKCKYYWSQQNIKKYVCILIVYLKGLNYEYVNETQQVDCLVRITVLHFITVTYNRSFPMIIIHLFLKEISLLLEDLEFYKQTEMKHLALEVPKSVQILQRNNYFS